MTSQKQLEGTRKGIRKGDPHTQVIPPTSQMVAGRRQCNQRSTIRPSHQLKYALQIFTDTSKQGWGTHLNEHIARGDLSLPESKLHINYLELKAIFLAKKSSKNSVQTPSFS